MAAIYPAIDSPTYTSRQKVRGFTVQVSPISIAHMDANAAGRMLRKRLPAWTSEDHLQASERHRRLAIETDEEWKATYEKAIHRLFGRPPRLEDYRISGIGRDEFDKETKDRLRSLSFRQTEHRAAATAHSHAARKRSMEPKVERRRFSRL